PPGIISFGPAGAGNPSVGWRAGRSGWGWLHVPATRLLARPPNPGHDAQYVHTQIMSDHLYAYGVVEDADFELDVDGVAGATQAYTVSHGPLAAVVTDIDTLDPELTDENARAHDDVLQDVLLDAGGRTVVPMQFASVVKNARTLKHVLPDGRRPAPKC